MLEELMNGKPSVYDVSSFVAIVLLLCVVFGVHLRQIRHNRAIADLKKILGVKDQG